MTDAFLITCEHGGNRIPAACLRLFRARSALLNPYRSQDPGALVMAKALAGAFGAPLVASTVSRLLIDLNRSTGKPVLYSGTTRVESPVTRVKIPEQHYLPYRAQVELLIGQPISRGLHVVHVSSHSFTPVLDGKVRGADTGLLHQPERRQKDALCARWKASLAVLAPGLRVRRNYPYAEKGDGLTKHLRLRYPGSVYVGIELEVNQRIVLAAGRRWTALRSTLINSLRSATSTGPASGNSPLLPPYKEAASANRFAARVDPA